MRAQQNSRHHGRTLRAGLLALALASAATAALAAPRLLVVEKKEGNLAVVDPATMKVLWRTPTGTDSHEVAAAPDGKRAFVSNYGGPGGPLHTLAVVDLDARKTLTPIDIAPLHSAHSMTVRDGKLFFTAESNKVVARYDLATGKVDWLLGTAQDRSHILVLGPGGMMATANVNSGTVSIMVPVSLTFAGSQRPEWSVVAVPTGAGSQGVDITPDGKFLWVMAARDGKVSVVDIAAKKVVDTIAMPWKAGNRLKITPDGKTALVAGEELAAIDMATKTVRTLKLAPTGGEGILITPDGATAYVALPQESKVAVVDLASFTVKGYVETGASPDGMAWLAN